MTAFDRDHDSLRLARRATNAANGAHDTLRGQSFPAPRDAVWEFDRAEREAKEMAAAMPARVVARGHGVPSWPVEREPRVTWLGRTTHGLCMATSVAAGIYGAAGGRPWWFVVALLALFAAAVTGEAE